jgi:hypothetical protein
VAWGLPCAIVTIAYHILHVRGVAWTAIAGLAVACGTIGYILAAWLWDECEAHYDRGGPANERAT